jgi:glucose/arabinose dehydrogenase
MSARAVRLLVLGIAGTVWVLGWPVGTVAAKPAPSLVLTPIATLQQPVAMAVRTGDPTLYVVEKTGRVRAIRNGQVDPTPVLDLTGQVSLGGEQGLLGLAFAPSGTHLYVNYTDTAGDTRVVEYAMAGGIANLATRRELLFVDQPFANHNGGTLAFAPDGRLWIGLGDGGSGGDPLDNAQSLGTLLGKMLRIDPRPSGGRPYTVPADNPYVTTPGARPEIWSYGLRNPWQFSFDRRTGDLWIGDVGQGRREEIDFQPAKSRGGQNYGWARLEGSLPYSGVAPANAVPPIFEYERANGNCAVTGGRVYRGGRITSLRGEYVFADFCLGQLRALRRAGDRIAGERSLGLSASLVAAFGEDHAGELYVLSLQGQVFRIDAA